MQKAFSRDTYLRIQKHIAAPNNSDQSLTLKAENSLIRFGSKAVEPLLIMAQEIWTRKAAKIS